MCFLSKAEKRVCRVLKICCSSSSGMTSASSSSCVETGMYGALLSGPSGIYSCYIYCTQLLAVLCSSLCEVSIPPPYGFYKYSIITNIFLILSLTLCSSPSFPCHLPLKMTVYNFCSKSRMTFFFSESQKVPHSLCDFICGRHCSLFPYKYVLLKSQSKCCNFRWLQFRVEMGPIFLS